MSTPDFFRSRLDAMTDLRHPLVILANRMPWASIEATLTPMFKGGCSRRPGERRG
jgi:IS5 family transposase